MTVSETHKQQIDAALAHEDPEEWLDLWHTTQGGENWRRKHQHIADILPFPSDEKIKILDLCAGPGDLGREMLHRYPDARVDAIDRDYFLLSMGESYNRQSKHIIATHIGDCWSDEWHASLTGEYDVIGVTTALHWLSANRLAHIFRDLHALLKNGGLLLFNEPGRVCTRPLRLAPGEGAFTARSMLI